MGFSPRKKTWPEVLLRSPTSPAWSLSLSKQCSFLRATPIAAAMFESSTHIPKNLLDGRPVGGCWLLHEPAHNPHSMCNVWPSMYHVSQTPDYTALQRGINNLCLIIFFQFEPALHGRLTPIAPCHPYSVKYRVCIALLTQSN